MSEHVRHGGHAEHAVRRHENGMPSPGWLSNNWLASGQAAAAVILQVSACLHPASLSTKLVAWRGRPA